MLAYVIPVISLSVKQTGVPVPQLVCGFQLEKVTSREKELTADPRELEVRAMYQKCSNTPGEKFNHPTEFFAADKLTAVCHIEALKDDSGRRGSVAEISVAGKVLANMPKDEESARKVWMAACAAANVKALPLSGMPPHAAQFSGDPQGTPKEQTLYSSSRRNFYDAGFLPDGLHRAQRAPSPAVRHLVAAFYSAALFHGAGAGCVFQI